MAERSAEPERLPRRISELERKISELERLLKEAGERELQLRKDNIASMVARHRKYVLSILPEGCPQSPESGEMDMDEREKSLREASQRKIRELEGLLELERARGAGAKKGQEEGSSDEGAEEMEQLLKEVTEQGELLIEVTTRKIAELERLLKEATVDGQQLLKEASENRMEQLERLLNDERREASEQSLETTDDNADAAAGQEAEPAAGPSPGLPTPEAPGQPLNQPPGWGTIAGPVYDRPLDAPTAERMLPELHSQSQHSFQDSADARPSPAEEPNPKFQASAASEAQLMDELARLRAQLDAAGAESKEQAKRLEQATAEADAAKAESKEQAKRLEQATAEADAAKAESKEQAKRLEQAIAEADAAKAESSQLQQELTSSEASRSQLGSQLGDISIYLEEAYKMLGALEEEQQAQAKLQEMRAAADAQRAGQDQLDEKLKDELALDRVKARVDSTWASPDLAAQPLTRQQQSHINSLINSSAAVRKPPTIMRRAELLSQSSPEPAAQTSKLSSGRDPDLESMMRREAAWASPSSPDPAAQPVARQQQSHINSLINSSAAVRKPPTSNEPERRSPKASRKASSTERRSPKAKGELTKSLSLHQEEMLRRAAALTTSSNCKSPGSPSAPQKEASEAREADQERMMRRAQGWS